MTPTTGFDLNVELLEKVKKIIRARPEGFDMDAFIYKAEEPACSTVACIAGHVAMLVHPEVDYRYDEQVVRSVQRAAIAALLNIPEEEAEKRWRGGFKVKLFYTHYWPDFLRREHLSTVGPKAEAEVACKAIDYYIQHPEELIKDGTDNS